MENSFQIIKLKLNSLLFQTGNQQQQRHPSQSSRGGRRNPASAHPSGPPSIINSGWGSEDTPDNDSTIITDTGATVTTNDDQGSINTVKMASAASLKEHDSITVITEGVGSGPGNGNSNNQYDRDSLEKGVTGSLNMEQGIILTHIYQYNPK